MMQTNFSQMRNSVGRLTPKHTSARELGAVPRVNTSKKMVPPRCWSLRDRAKYVHGLSGSIAANGRHAITIKSNSVPLDNDGDPVMLVQGTTARHAASHNGKQAGNGAVVKMGGKYRPSHQTRHHGDGGICSPNDNSILAIAGGPKCVVMVLLSGLKGRASVA